MPAHHHPLGPLKPHDQTRAPPPPEGSARWRTNLARGDAARAYEVADTEFVTKLLAFMVQQNLDDHKRAVPDFPVSLMSAYPLASERLLDILITETFRSSATSWHVDHHGPMYGYCSPFHSRVHISGDVQ